MQGSEKTPGSLHRKTCEDFYLSQKAKRREMGAPGVKGQTGLRKSGQAGLMRDSGSCRLS